MEKYLSYDEVFLIPDYSKEPSRSGLSTAVSIGNRSFRTPAIPANMKCVIDENISKWMSENCYFYIMHRFNKNVKDEPNTDNWNFVKRANEENWKTISISVGVQDYDMKFLEKCMFSQYRIDFITIDIAHGHSILMKNMLERIHRMYHMEIPEGADCDRSGVSAPFIIAGNVCTPEACDDLIAWGANMVKVGIAQGGACTTYGKTGFGSPMFTTVKMCAASGHAIIADGGIRMNGDIAKALVAGAKMVMAGSLFAVCKDSPAENITINKCASYGGRPEKIITHKKYFGSASEYNTHSQHHIEGTMIELPVSRWTYEEKLAELEEDLQSSISYGGGKLDPLHTRWGIRTP